jgi:hypothetical protein
MRRESGSTLSGKAGGHGTIAGGQYPLDGSDIEQLITTLKQNFLRLMNKSGRSKALIASLERRRLPVNMKF